MNNLKIFDNKEFGQVRTLIINDKPYFVAVDIAKSLGYKNTNDAIARHCKKDGVAFHDLTDNLGRNQQAKFITEGNLYRLITNSELPTAEKFESWVFDEVLPSIRQTGGYVNNDDLFINTYLPNADEQTKLMFKSQLGVIRNLNSKIEQDKNKVLFADAVSTSHTDILIGDLAKILKQSGIDVGAKRLFQWLRDNKYLISRKGTDYNMPSQKSMELGLFRIKETSINHPDGHTSISKTPKVTGKGQQYFVSKFLNKHGRKHTSYRNMFPIN